MMSGGSFVTRQAALSGRRCKIGSYRSDEEAASWVASGGAAPAGAATASGAAAQTLPSAAAGFVVSKSTLPKTEIEAAEWLTSTAAAAVAGVAGRAGSTVPSGPRGGEPRVVLVDGANLQRSDIKLAMKSPEPEPEPEPEPTGTFERGEGQQQHPRGGNDDEDEDDDEEDEEELPYIADLEGSAISHPSLCVGLRLVWVEVAPPSEGSAW